MLSALPPNVKISPMCKHLNTILFTSLNTGFLGLFVRGGGVLGRGFPPGPVIVRGADRVEPVLAVRMPWAANRLTNKKNRTMGYAKCV
jgi:hypothetical protein